VPLPPGSGAGMAVRLEIPEPGPAIGVTVQIGTELGGGVHLARGAPRGPDAGWRATGRLGNWLLGMLTSRAERLVSEARKRLRVAGALPGRGGGRGRCPTHLRSAPWPSPIPHDIQPQQGESQHLVEKQVVSPAAPSSQSGSTWRS
jgi:hypothetical protein